MKLELSGAETMATDRATVWACLTDPAFVARSAPGNEEVTILGPGRFRLSIGVGIAIFKVKFDMDVQMHDLVPQERARLTATGGAHGTHASVASSVQLEDAGPRLQQLNWEAVGEVSGTLADLGAPIVEAVIRAMSRDFWQDFARRVEGHA
ncbi:MAG TPA: SRPBCC domain-containing protein [Gemmatimonadales bacterium]|nr:SRPBCC domain-containing protein [Gemmatimonadales bacterium]